MSSIVDNNYRGYYCGFCNREKITDAEYCYYDDCFKSITYKRDPPKSNSPELRVVRNDSYLPNNFMRVFDMKS